MRERLRTFSAHRSKTDRESTSTLSPHVHYGEISNRHIYYVVRPSLLGDREMKVCWSFFLVADMSASLCFFADKYVHLRRISGMA